jgi:hypothetical protein
MIIAQDAPTSSQRPMHVQQAYGARPFVQVIDVLGDDEQIAPPLGIEPCQCDVRIIRLHLVERSSASIVERMHQVRIAGKGLGSGDILDVVTFPESIGPTKGCNAAVGANACSGQNDDICQRPHCNFPSFALLT